MKNLIFIFLTLIQPFIVFSQTKKDAEHVMGNFMKFYNAGQDDSIYSLFSAHDRKAISPERNAESMKWFRDSLGSMKSYEYLGIDKEDQNPDLYVFITYWSKGGKKTSSFTIDKDNKFETFRLWTSSGGIDKLLKNNKAKH